MEISVSIIIVGWNHSSHLKLCLDSIAQYKMPEHEVIYIDNASEDDSINMVKSMHPTVTVIENKENLGFCYANNQGIEISNGKYVFILNPDTKLSENCLSKLHDYMEHNSKVGICGPKMLMMEHPQQINSMGMYYLSSGKKKHIGDGHEDNGNLKSGPVPMLSGASMFCRKEALLDIGFFDTKLFAYSDDAELSLRSWSKGWECHIVADAHIYHFRNAGNKRSKDSMSLARFLALRNRFYVFWIYFPTGKLLKMLPYIFKQRLKHLKIGLGKKISNKKPNPELKAFFASFLVFVHALHQRRKFKIGKASFNQIFDLN